MNLSDFLCDVLISDLTRADWMLQPSVVSRTGEMKKLTKFLNGIMLFLGKFPDRLIFKQMTS